MARLLALALLLLAAAAVLRAERCETSADCAGHDAALFCGSTICAGGECAAGPSPCAARCFEAERRCVECVAHADCGIPGFVCDAQTRTCRGCRSHSDCPAGAWCSGGHWYCSQGLCFAPPAANRPCASAEQCDEAAQRCSTRCRTDDDCGGAWDYCTHRVRCDVATLQCVADAPLPADCTVCDSARQACVECARDADCQTHAWRMVQPFCAPPPEVPVCEAGRCAAAPNAHAELWTGPCALAEECSEERKRCIPRLCLDEQDASCSDGNDCNGRERCVNQVCAPALDARCPAGLTCDTRTLRCGDAASVVAAQIAPPSVAAVATNTSECQVDSDCPNRWLCRIVSRSSNKLRACRPCRNDAQCMTDGVTATCDAATGSCSAQARPGESAVITLQARPAVVAARPSAPTVDAATTTPQPLRAAAAEVDTLSTGAAPFWESGVFLAVLAVLWTLLVFAILIYIICYNLPLVARREGRASSDRPLTLASAKVYYRR